MTIRRIFPNTSPIQDYESFRRRAINLYREWLREIPRAVQKYPLDVSVAAGRARVRQEFETYSKFFDSLSSTAKPEKLAAMSAALLKGTQELIEVHNRWSQKTHVMRWFEGANERASPLLSNRNSERKVKIINESVNENNSSPFLVDFLTRPNQ